KDVNSHTVLDGIITTIMATIQRINIIGSREGSRNRRRLKANQTGKKFRVGIKSNISTNRNNLISGVDRCIHLNEIGRASCRERVQLWGGAVAFKRTGKQMQLVLAVAKVENGISMVAYRLDIRDHDRMA